MVHIARTFQDFGSYSPHLLVLVPIARTFHDFGSFSPHFLILVPIARTFYDFGSYRPHSVSRERLLVEQNGRKKSLGTPKGYSGPTVMDVLYPMVPSKLSRPHFQIWFI